MLSIFPELLVYQFLGITAIRLSVGIIGLYFAFKIFQKRNEVAEFLVTKNIPFGRFFIVLIISLFFVSGTLVFIGAYTQIACLVLAWMLIETMILDLWSKGLIMRNYFLYIPLIIISASLVFLGPGFLAFDLPF